MTFGRSAVRVLLIVEEILTSFHVCVHFLSRFFFVCVCVFWYVYAVPFFFFFCFKKCKGAGELAFLLRFSVSENYILVRITAECIRSI